MASTDYLRFNANSIKSLIKQKLLDEGTFTDQAFEDSNLSVIIDIFSYTFSVLMFYLNMGASEAIFTDTQLYENINRLVKMLGYNPIGVIPSTAAVTLSMKDNKSITPAGEKTIPKYTTYTTSIVDSSGFPVRYTFVDDFVVNVQSDNVVDVDYNPVLYNGTWKAYDKIFVAAGIPSETFTLENLKLSGSDKIYVSHNNVDVFVQTQNGTFYRYTTVTNLYNSTSKDTHVELRLNEKYQYTLKFGDNINGVRLTEGSKVFVVYLQTNGNEGQIGKNVIDGNADIEVRVDGFSEDFIKRYMLDVNGDGADYLYFGSTTVGYDYPPAETNLENLKLINEEASSLTKGFETVDEIRENAPNWFRMGSRLITEQDFKQYILATYATDIYDVKVMNNWEYMTTFQKWLDDYDKLTAELKFYDYAYTDSCDFNSIHIWLKSFNTDPISTEKKRQIERNVNKLKCLTSEVTFFDPLLVMVTPWLGGSYSVFNWDTGFENKIELVRDKNTFVTVERIKQRAINVVKDFFSFTNNKLGQTLNINNLYNSLSAIDGVKQVRTTYLPSGSSVSQTQYFDGLSFGIWTPHLLRGADITKISGNYKLKDFQFPILLDENIISDRIQVLADNFNINNIEY